MKRIWAPWRMKYISKTEEGNHCILCELGKSEINKENLMLHRSNQTYIVMNRFPYTNGHLMIVPKRHLDNPTKLSKAEMLEIGELTQLSINLLTEYAHPQGFNIGMNIGRVAGAGIDKHIHLHIVPRFNGDTNFMPVFADTRVISEDLLKTYSRLKNILKTLL